MKIRTAFVFIGWLSLIAGICIVMCASAYEDANARSHKDGKMTEHRVTANEAEIKSLIEDLDIQYQKAVKDNDAETMDRILGDDFILVTGRGKVYTKSELLEEARKKSVVYERQEDSERTVRVWGDTAVITALLWEKGVGDGKAFDKKLWFSDVYKLTPGGWKYVFAQSSIPLPDEN